MLKSIINLIKFDINAIVMMKRTGLNLSEWTVSNSEKSQSRSLKFE